MAAADFRETNCSVSTLKIYLKSWNEIIVFQAIFGIIFNEVLRMEEGMICIPKTS